MPELTPAQMSHRALIGLLMSLGGEATVGAEYLGGDAVGTPDADYAVEARTLPGGGVRLRVVPRPDVPDGGITLRPEGGR